LRDANLFSVGSRSGQIKPIRLRERKIPQPKDAPRETVDLFVAGQRDDLNRLSASIENWEADTSAGARDLFKIEEFKIAKPSDRLRPIKKVTNRTYLDVALHTPDEIEVLDPFIEYLKDFDSIALPDKRIEIGGLTFLPIAITPDTDVEELAKFSFLRVARGMPSLRPLRPITRSTAALSKKPPAFPASGPVDPTVRVAVFDGGIDENSQFRQYATAIDAPGVGPAVPQFIEHGTAVTSALLFGVIPESGDLAPPYAHVDHDRVLDKACGNVNDPNLYDVLARIRDVLQSKRYQFANISLGPDYSIEDDDINPWTATLDSLLDDGSTLVTIACGNSGEADAETGLNRIQVPSDGVNVLSVGACDSTDDDWSRSIYSSVGPGRSPGKIKPDVLAFGGSDDQPFPVVNRQCTRVIPTQGTSFASPLALRRAVGLRSHFGGELTPLAIKALLIHCAQNPSLHSKDEVGWGRLPDDLDAFVVCPTGVVRVVYQGLLNPGQYLRTPIPVPDAFPKGIVNITATFCIASATDPADPSNYTRSGLDIYYRPDSRKMEGKHPKTQPFFRLRDIESEGSLRENAHKWETVMHSSVRRKGPLISDPAFDVHYQTRVGGRRSTGSAAINYALVVTVTASSVVDLYDKVQLRYGNLLLPIQPRVTIQVRT
jgi:hypothetical protein